MTSREKYVNAVSVTH